MIARPPRGFSLIAAVFLVVVVALMATFLVSIGTLGRSAAAYAVVEARARFAAASGIEWAAAQVLADAAAPTCFASPTTFALGDVGSDGFIVTARCAASDVSEGNTDYRVFALEVVAERGQPGDEEYFRRALTASVASGP